MLKQISTYGILLLTIMVIIRAASLEKQENISDLYQRNADQLFTENNNTLRKYYLTQNFSSDILPTKIRRITKSNDIHLEHRKANHHSRDLDLYQELFTEAQLASPLFENAVLIVEDSSLSLDRESTINSNLSLLFPRQRIRPKPSKD